MTGTLNGGGVPVRVRGEQDLVVYESSFQLLVNGREYTVMLLTIELLQIDSSLYTKSNRP